MDLILYLKDNVLVYKVNLKEATHSYGINNYILDKHIQVPNSKTYHGCSTLSVDTGSDEIDRVILECIKVINKHIDRVELTVGMLAHELGMSHSALFKRIKSKTGFSVNKLIRKVRLEKAKDLLLHSSQCIYEIAYSTGFRDVKYFRKQFKKEYKMSPSNYRKIF